MPVKEHATSPLRRADGIARGGFPLSQTFEGNFLRLAKFRGENRLDQILMSLLRLSDHCSVLPLGENGLKVLLNIQNVEKKIQLGPRSLGERYKSLKNERGFDLVKFLQENAIPLDKICGTSPMIFNDYRRVIHSLRLAWAFTLTFKTHKPLKEDTVPLRVRKGHFKRTKFSPLVESFVHIYSQFRRMKIVDEKEVIKVLKNSLCYHVSESMDQDELPEGTHFNLIPFTLRPSFRALDKDRKVKFFFSFLQSKVLCEEVPEEFVLEALQKHQKQLSTPHRGISDSAKSELKKVASEFGKRVSRFYNESRGYFPTNKATFAFPRDRGGVKGDLVYHDRLQSGLCPPAYGDSKTDRMEPMVIGLFGQPGQGKSRCLPFLIERLSKFFPKVSRSDLTYSRTCNTDHWDGYYGQPIVILDDLGQSTLGNDIREFQTLVSCNPYVVPMADLPEKGTYFSSPIIIATSNLKFGMELQVPYGGVSPVIDYCSFWRRFHFPLYVEKGDYYSLKEDPNWVRTNNLLFSKINRDRMSASLSGMSNRGDLFTHDTTFFKQQPWVGKPSRDMLDSISGATERPIDQKIWRPQPSELNHLAEDISKLFEKRVKTHSMISMNWNQTVRTGFDSTESKLNEEFFRKEVNPFLPDSLSDLGDNFFQESSTNSHYLKFSAYPPSGPLPVRVEPIREPLKVRTITAGIGDTFCLKPLQVAMWLALGTYPQFCLTHGTDKLYENISRIYDSSETDDVWISGDYSAATDSFAIEASQILMSEILTHIDHEPTKRWAMKEISPHVLVYPAWSKLEPVLQESGQLMGSLLSFPLLCLLNDCTARSIGLTPHQYLINGDDILMRTKAHKYHEWKNKVEDFGLSLSLGKNYIHPYYGTVNSQLICGGEVSFSGKQRILDRHSRILGECLRDLEEQMLRGGHLPDDIHELFKEVNRQKLSRTIRSIDAPVSHGGLSAVWSSPERRASLNERSLKTEKLVYIHEMLSKIEPEKGCISVPYLSKEKKRTENMAEVDRIFQKVPDSKKEFEDYLDSSIIPRVRKRVLKNPHLRDLFFGQDLQELPPLSFLGAIQIPFSDEKVKEEIQEQIFKIFFKRFLDGNVGFTYDDYRSHILHQLGVLRSNTKVSTQYLVGVLDLDVSPDFLRKIPMGYKVQEFSKDQFKKDLKKDLEPKKLEFPADPHSIDFSSQLVQDMEHLQKVYLDMEEIDIDQGQKQVIVHDEIKRRMWKLNSTQAVLKD